MKTIYSGFDTISFAVKGALCPQNLKRLKAAKEKAVKEQAGQRISIGNPPRDLFVTPTGQKGGFAFVLDMGRLEQMISVKDSMDRNQWNGFVKIRALGLALDGWKLSIEKALEALTAIGFHIVDISLNRVDYAVDILTKFPISLDPHRVVTHSRRKIKCHHEATNVVPMTTVMQGTQVQTITIGKMPSSQICIYDKRAEVLSKRNFAWFEIWGLDRFQACNHVLRIEVRAGKDALKKFGITTLEDFRSRIGDLLSKTIRDTRYVEEETTDTNIARRGLDPVWSHVSSNVQSALSENMSYTCRTRIIQVLKEEKAIEAEKLTLGNMMNLAISTDIGFEHISDVIKPIMERLSEMQNEGSPANIKYSKKYLNAKDRLRFM